MKIRHIILCLALVAAATADIRAQKGDIVVTLDEAFFEALLDAVFKDDRTIDFAQKEAAKGESVGQAFAEGSSQAAVGKCDETVRLRREVKGKRTAVQLRDGKIYAPIAFTGTYDPPILSCIDYSGIADTEITLEFDQARQALVGTAKVRKVNLNGAAGLAGGVATRMVQRSIDEKINPINILGMDKVSFTLPVQDSVNVVMKAVGMAHEIADGAIKVRVTYEFVRL